MQDTCSAKSTAASFLASVPLFLSAYCCRMYCRDRTMLAWLVRCSAINKSKTCCSVSLYRGSGVLSMSVIRTACILLPLNKKSAKRFITTEFPPVIKFLIGQTLQQGKSTYPLIGAVHYVMPCYDSLMDG